MRIVFMGTPDFAVPALTGIVGGGHDVVAVYTREPARAGRGMALRRSPVHATADRFAIPVVTPGSLRSDEAAKDFAAYAPDVAVVVAYGMILPERILAIPALGCLNLHASLLPRWRGAAPIQRAIMAGDEATGVAVMRMEKGLDTGPVAMVERVAIGGEATAGELHDRLSVLGADLMVRALAALQRGGLGFTPQPDMGVTYAAKITNEEAQIDWRRPAGEVHDLVRGLSPFPGAYTVVDLGRGPERLKILRTAIVADGSGEPGTAQDADLTIACGLGAVRLRQVQRAGSKPMSGVEFLRGAKIGAGARFG
jgi:methionyl-tRNA formyltransferase